MIWIAMHIAALALLVGFRLAVPFTRSLRHRMQIEAVVPEGPGVVSVSITGSRLDQLEAEAGQFFLWRFVTREGWWQAHPFSLSAPPQDELL